MPPTNNFDLLQEYIDSEDIMTSGYTIEILKEIQSRLIENKVSAPVESYPI